MIYNVSFVVCSHEFLHQQLSRGTIEVFIAESFCPSGRVSFTCGVNFPRCRCLKTYAVSAVFLWSLLCMMPSDVDNPAASRQPRILLESSGIRKQGVSRVTNWRCLSP